MKPFASRPTMPPVRAEFSPAQPEKPFHVEPALAAGCWFSNCRQHVGSCRALFLALTLAWVSITGCSRNQEQSGVELVMSSSEPGAATTFELRFERTMTAASDIGVPVESSPLVIQPALAGTFTWLSPQAGVFTPAEPLALDCRYQLSLRRGLRCADGKAVSARLRRTITTPPFGLLAQSPRHAETNASCQPQVKLAFNADVLAGDTSSFLYFTDVTGRRLSAEVRQGTASELRSMSRYGESISTWLQDFESTKQGTGPGEGASDPDPADEVGNLLIARPTQPLPLGKNWRLVIAPGLTSADRGLRLSAAEEVPIGDIMPLELETIAAQNYIYSGASIRLQFSKTLSPAVTNELSSWVEVHPKPTNLVVDLRNRTLILSGSFHGNTAYNLSLRAGLPAAEPFTLARQQSFTVEMPPVVPRLYFPAFSGDQLAAGNRAFPLLAVNVAKVRVRAKLLGPETAIHALRGYKEYYRTWRERHDSGDWAQPYKAVNYNVVPGRTIFDQTFDLQGKPDAAERLELGWDKLLKGRQTGVVFLEAQQALSDDAQPGPGTQALIQLTDLGLTWKQSASGVEVFVFSHTTGRPMPESSAYLVSNENEFLQEAMTDASGRAHLGSRTNAQWIAVRHGSDFHAAPLEANGIWLGDPEMMFASWSGEEPRRVMLFSDRRLYRPGEQLHLQAIVRDWTESGLAVPKALSGTLECLDARDRKFFETNAAFSTSGGWSVSVPLPTGCRGSYRTQLRLGVREYNHCFQVQDFQPDAFELSLHTPPQFGPGEKIALPLSARYLFGKVLSRAQVKWTMQVNDGGFLPLGFEAFTFCAAKMEWQSGRASSSLSLSGQGTLGGSNYLIEAELPTHSTSPQPRAASLLVEVTDLNQQTLTRYAQFVRHSSEFYLGLLRPEIVTDDKPLAVRIAAVRTDGAPWPDPVHAQIKLDRVDWNSVRVRGAGKTMRMIHEPIFTNILRREIVVPPSQRPGQAYDPSAGTEFKDLPALPIGEYLLEVRTSDPGGHPVVSSARFWVSAPGPGGWNYRNDVHLTLKPDRAIYGPGDHATILLQAPFSGTAWITVEREHVRRSFVQRCEGNAPSIRVPIDAADVPNVYVCATLVRGTEDCPRQVKEPEYRFGYCQLRVADPQSRLTVNIAPTATNYLPGQMVDVRLDVADAAGQPAPGAQLLLYAVDEGVLSLSDDSLPDPHAFFYATRGLGVHSGISLPSLLTEDSEELRFDNKGYVAGGGGKSAVRKNFLACAFWSASLIADSGGQARASFPAPDSLTRYRLVAVAYTAASRFGHGKSAFAVSKPLQIEPSLPAFATISDRLAARAVIHNQTARGGPALVTLELDGRVRPSSALGLTQTVALLPHGSAAVEFPVEFIAPGESKWIWRARFMESGPDKFVDAVESRLEVGHIAPVLREILLGRVSAPSANLLSGANSRLLAGDGTITVQLANTRLSELGETVSQLLHYPYGCAEQTGSSLLPWIVLRHTNGLPLLQRPAAQIDAAIRAGIDRLFSMQTDSGGLGYWPGARTPMLWASAYGGMIIALAETRGVQSPKAPLTALLNYLSGALRSTDPNEPEFFEKCLALYALALAGKPEPAYHEKLFGLREKMSEEARALLALAVLESGGAVEMAGALLQPATKATRHAHDYFGSAAREEAIRLLSWTRYQSGSPFVDQLVTSLSREQKAAHWGTTQGNAWALLALTEYARRVEAGHSPAEGVLRCGNQSVQFALKSESNLFTHTFALRDLMPGGLTLSNNSKGVVYTTVQIEARPIEAQQPPQERGFALQRLYQRLDDQNRAQDLRDLRVGDRVLVTLRLSLREPARYVAVDDALPSILEAVNPEFRTREARTAGQEADDTLHWSMNFRELRKDRCLSFADWVNPGDYTWRYLARVRAAGTVTAPAAKVEEMYHPGRYGLSATQVISSQGL